MRIVVITDLHANLPALQAVLDAIHREGYDQVVHTGDTIGIGPHPTECLAELLDVPNIHLLMGNHDAWLVDGFPEVMPEWVGRDAFAGQLWTQVQENAHWTHAQIGAQLRSRVAAWPLEIKREIEGVHLTFQHYALKSNGKELKPLVHNPTAANLHGLFEAPDSDILFYGHVHGRSDIAGRTRYVNPGSSGCHAEATARYCVAEFRPGGCTIAHHSVPYDDRPLFQAFKRRQVPGRQFFYHMFFGGRFTL
jgi:putative phosphoesterase